MTTGIAIDYDQMVANLRGATTLDQLQQWAQEIPGQEYQPEELEELRGYYRTRKLYLMRDRLDDIDGKVVSVHGAELVPTQFGTGVSLSIETQDGRQLQPFSSAVRIVRRMSQLAQTNNFPAKVVFTKEQHTTADGVNGTMWQVRIVELPDTSPAWGADDIPF